MNKQQIKGKSNEIAGNIQASAGKLIGSKEQEIKGNIRAQSGKVLKTMGNLNESLKESNKK